MVWHYLIPWRLSSLFPGPYAVTLFFELSGLLITWLLLQERDTTGRIDKKQFYSRRALRLFPVFYVVWVLARLAGPFAGHWAYFFYAGDYYTAITHRYSDMTPAWSLGVEEKFYLLWPFLLASFDPRTLIKPLAGILLLEPAYRFILCSLGHCEYSSFAFDTHLDPLVVGCLIAILAKQGWRVPRCLSHPLTPTCALIGVFLFQNVADVVTYLLAVILISVVCRPPKLLNNTLISYFGLISYSLYLCHEYVVSVIWPRLFGASAGHSMSLVLTSQFALAVAVASALHFAVERPFLNLKRKLHRARPAA